MACDESTLAPLFNEYIKVRENVRDLADSWIGAIRKGTGKSCGQGAQRQNGVLKPIKRNRVKLSMLGGALSAATGGLAGSDKGARDHFGADAKDADEMEFNMWKMRTLRTAVEKEAVATRKKVS